MLLILLFIVCVGGWCACAPPGLHQTLNQIKQCTDALKEESPKEKQTKALLSSFLAQQYDALPADPITLAVRDTSLTAILEACAAQANLSLSIDAGVKGLVPLVRARNQPVAHVLRPLLAGHKLALHVEDGVVRVAKRTVLEKALRPRVLRGEGMLTTREIPVTHLPFKEKLIHRLKEMWEQCCRQAPGIAAAQYLFCDPGSHTVLCQGTHEQVAAFERLLRAIDVPRHQVAIHARLVLASKDFEQNFGIAWDAVYDEHVRATLRTHPGSRKAQVVAMPIVLGGGDAHRRLNLLLNAAEHANKVRTILKPSLVTGDGQQAELLEGQSVPIESLVEESVEGRTRSTRSATYKDVGIKLRVRPEVSPDGTRVRLAVHVENSHITSTSGAYPTITTTRATTHIEMRSGQTTMIGGLLKQRREGIDQGVPFLRSLPLIGHLFNGKRSTDEKAQLLIFLRPKVIE